MSRDIHQGEVQAAIGIAEEVAQSIQVAAGHCEVLFGAIQTATSGYEGVESAQNAMSFAAGGKKKLDEAHQSLLVVMDELRRYGDGF